MATVTIEIPDDAKRYYDRVAAEQGSTTEELIQRQLMRSMREEIPVNHDRLARFAEAHPPPQHWYDERTDPTQPE